MTEFISWLFQNYLIILHLSFFLCEVEVMTADVVPVTNPVLGKGQGHIQDLGDNIRENTCKGSQDRSNVDCHENGADHPSGLGDSSGNRQWRQPRHRHTDTEKQWEKHDMKTGNVLVRSCHHDKHHHSGNHFSWLLQAGPGGGGWCR